MELAATTATETLEVRHQYKATPEQVFAAWANPEALSQWFGPHSHKCSVEQWDMREGGEYRMRMIPVAEDTECGGDSSQDSVCAGQFVQIIESRTIAMTFSWIENGSDIGETLLTVEFFEKENGTELVLTHERLPDPEVAEMHKGGWMGTVECLEQYLDQHL